MVIGTDQIHINEAAYKASFCLPIKMLCCLYWWVDSLSENESFITYSSVPYHMSLNSPTQQTSSVGSYNIPLSRSAVLGQDHSGTLP